MKKILVLICLGLLFSCQSLFAEEKTVSLVTLYDYAPYCMLAKDTASKNLKETIPPGEDTQAFKGYSWDIVRESFHAMDYTIKLKATPWKRAMMLVKKGEVDVIMPAGKNDKRLKTFHYSEEPINKVDFVVYVEKDSSMQWDGLESIDGKDIAAKRGWNYGNKWEGKKEKININPVNKILQGFKMLDANRVDGYAGYKINFDYALEQEGIKHKYKSLPPFGSSKEYLMGNKDNDRVSRILKVFDKGKRKIDQDGTFDKIEKKWLGN